MGIRRHRWSTAAHVALKMRILWEVTVVPRRIDIIRIALRIERPSRLLVRPLSIRTMK